MRNDLPHYPSRQAVEAACGCLVLIGLGGVALTAIVFYLWGPLAAFGVVMVAIALLGLMSGRGRS